MQKIATVPRQVQIRLLKRVAEAFASEGTSCRNPYAHICRVIHERKLLTKPQLEAALWYTISDLHAEKAADENNPLLDGALAACTEALKEIKALPDDGSTISPAAPT
jgi:hypothetical protein